MPDVSGRDLDSDVLACIELCSDCHKACLQTAMHGLQIGGEEGEAYHARLMLDCAEICQTSANFMLRGSDLHGQICAACAVVCARCAEECERLGDDDPRMAACAEECRRCAQSCRRMSRSEPAPRRSATRRIERPTTTTRLKETKSWKPKTITPPTARTGSPAKKSPSSLRTVSNRSR